MYERRAQEKYVAVRNRLINSSDYWKRICDTRNAHDGQDGRDKWTLTRRSLEDNIPVGMLKLLDDGRSAEQLPLTITNEIQEELVRLGVERFLDEQRRKILCEHFKIHGVYSDWGDLDLTKRSSEFSEDAEKQMLSTDYGRGIFFLEISSESELSFLRANPRLFTTVFERINTLLDEKFVACQSHQLKMYPEMEGFYVQTEDDVDALQQYYYLTDKVLGPSRYTRSRRREIVSVSILSTHSGDTTVQPLVNCMENVGTSNQTAATSQHTITDKPDQVCR